VIPPNPFANTMSTLLKLSITDTHRVLDISPIVVSHRTNIGNLTVGEHGKPELITVNPLTKNFESSAISNGVSSSNRCEILYLELISTLTADLTLIDDILAVF
jgi:hypothetical protein